PSSVARGLANRIPASVVKIGSPKVKRGGLAVRCSYSAEMRTGLKDGDLLARSVVDGRPAQIQPLVEWAEQQTRDPIAEHAGAHGRADPELCGVGFDQGRRGGVVAPTHGVVGAPARLADESLDRLVAVPAIVRPADGLAAKAGADPGVGIGRQ